MRPKIYFQLGLYLLVAVLSSYLISASCCFNPLASETLFCNSHNISVNDCCPPKANFSSYYNSSLFPYGPVDDNDCKQNYYSEGQCGSPDCDEVCCCSPQFIPSSINWDLNSTVELRFCNAIKGARQVYVGQGAGCALQCGITPHITAPSGNCTDPRITPKINVTLDLERGKKSVNVRWLDSCPADALYYKITRCQGMLCKEFSPVTGSSWKDQSAELKFDTDYTYQVEGVYAIQGYIANSTKYSINLGNVECMGHADQTKFCLQYSTYGQFFSYFRANNPAVNDDNFYDYIKTTYATKLNKAYHCDERNKLQGPELACSDSEVCVTELDSVTNAYKPLCKVKAACEPDYKSSPFGLFSSVTDCYALGFCYYDTSKTLVDKCYACSQSMSCYDYKSSVACNDDHCGIGNCVWQDTVGFLGVGVCKNSLEENCRWCNKAGSKNLDSTSYNSVFDICSQEKAVALSTDSNPCFFVNGSAKTCNSLICTDLSDCSVSIPELYFNNSFKRSAQNKCDLVFCEKFSGKCMKNANGDDIPDCIGLPSSCEKDIYAPTVTINKIEQDNTLVGLSIYIEDNTSTGFVMNPSYTTYLCLNSCDDKDLFVPTNISQLSVNGLLLSELTTSNKIGDLLEGTNMLYYFSEDSSKNLALMKTVEIEAHRNNSRPELYDVAVEGTYEKQSMPFTDNPFIFYINNRAPKIDLFFREDGVRLISLELRDSSQNIAVSAFDITKIPDREFATNFSLLMPTGFLLNESTYTLGIVARGPNNKLLQSEVTINVDFHSAASNISISPAPQICNGKTIINVSSFVMNLTFSKDVQLQYVNISGLDLLNNFTGANLYYSKIYSANIKNLSIGKKHLIYAGKDYYGNLATNSLDFYMKKNFTRDTVRLIQPAHGVSKDYTFTLQLESDYDVDCRYSMSPISRDEEFYTIMNKFDSSTGTVMTKNSFVLTDTFEHKLYVLCKDVCGRDTPYTFVYNLSVDTTPPVVNLNTFPASPVAEVPINITLNAIADEPVLCRYSTQNESYYDMAINFTLASGNDFLYKKMADIYLIDSGSYTYYVSCENLAGLVSQPIPINILVDTSIPLSITDHTREFQSNMTPTVAVETNKRAACSYSFISPVPDASPRLYTPDSYAHVSTLNANLSGQINAYIKCVKGDEAVTQKITFIIDLTPPAMQYVNDTAYEVLNAELSPYKDQIFVRWSALDNESGFRGLDYNFTLIEAATRSPVINWTDADLNYDDNSFEGWIRRDSEGDRLNLSDKTKYLFKVSAGNVLNRWSDVMQSDGVTTDFSLQNNNTCLNNKKDGSETDVDCGGSCASCPKGKACLKDYDCISDYCDNRVCEAPSCSDNNQNGNETDADCGGDCDKCELSKKCKTNSDCESGFCSNKICKTQDTCSNAQINEDEAGVDCGGVCPQKCPSGETCKVASDCEQGLECKSGLCKLMEEEQPPVNPSEADTDSDGMPDVWENQNSLDAEDPNDAALDNDEDGFTNLEEYQNGTDPNIKDQSLEEEGGSFGTVMIIIIIIVVVIAIALIIYTQYFKKKPSAQPPIGMAPRPSIIRPMMPQRRIEPQYHSKLKETKIKNREAVFDSFSTGEGNTKKPTETAADQKIDSNKEEFIQIDDIKKKEALKKQTLKKPNDDVFQKLSEIIDKNKDEKKTDHDIDKSLSKISSMAASVKGPALDAVFGTENGDKYHRIECATIKSLSKTKLKKYRDAEEAKKAGLKNCSLCLPKR